MSTPTPPLPDHERDAWRDFLLQELVTYLGDHKEEIIGRYQEQSQGRLSRDQIEAQGLLDFDISITSQRSAINLRTRSGLFQDQPDPLRRLAFGGTFNPVTPEMDTQQIITIGTPFIVFGAVFVVLVLIWEK